MNIKTELCTLNDILIGVNIMVFEVDAYHPKREWSVTLGFGLFWVMISNWD